MVKEYFGKEIGKILNNKKKYRPLTIDILIQIIRIKEINNYLKMDSYRIAHSLTILKWKSHNNNLYLIIIVHNFKIADMVHN